MLIEFLKRRAGDIASMVISALISAGILALIANLYAAEWFKQTLPAGSIMTFHEECPEGWDDAGGLEGLPGIPRLRLCAKAPP